MTEEERGRCDPKRPRLRESDTQPPFARGDKGLTKRGSGFLAGVRSRERDLLRLTGKRVKGA